jgi:hypothetical protein
VLQPVHDDLIARHWSAERYLREEMEWIRSAVRPEHRDRYLGMTRKGRAVAMPRQFKERVLEGLAGWEDKMGTVGVVDDLGIATALARHLEKMEPPYRCVLVDEGQDFGNLELAIVRGLAPKGANDLFICGDGAQAVTTKHQLLKEVDIAIPPSRERRLTKNYRNSRDILLAAQEVLASNFTEDMLDREDFEFFDPEYSAFSASTPLLLEANNLEEEIACALRFAERSLDEITDGKACLAFCGFTLYELSQFGHERKLPVLDGTTNIEEGTIFLSDLEQTKGFEFDTVCVLNCSAGILPSGDAPESEQYRDLSRLYVAMTRAKTDLVLSWSTEQSPFLREVQEFFLPGHWREYFDGDGEIELMGKPHSLEAHRQSGTHRKSWSELTGDEFLYTTMALGLSVELITKIRDLVDGQGMTKNRRRTRWRCLGDARDDLQADATVRRLWGPAVAAQFEDLVEQLTVDDEMSGR